MKRVFAIAGLAWLLAGCAQNPVTGERNLQFYGADWEREVGAGLYAPMRQSQGGDLVIDPELTEYVQEVGGRLAAQARRKNELQFEFHVINDSTPNAWALPGGKIAINRGLLTELESEAELAAVLGHEVVHADAAHGARQQSKGMLTQIGAMASLILIDSTVDSTSGKQAAAMVPLLGAQLLSTRYSRDAEREADEYGMLYMSESGYDPQGAVELQETFLRLSEGRRDDWMSGLFASHPPSRERVENNRKTAANLPAGGENGRERYQQRMAMLVRGKPAYDAYDLAMKSASEQEYGTARSHLDEALRLESRESLFHALDGDLKVEGKRHKAALRSYDRAVILYPDFFYHHLRRGHIYYELEQMEQARVDLENSLELLPTAPAHYLLGNLDRDAGNLESARSHYQQAAQTDSESGRMAEREMVLLDIKSDPGKFVATAGAVDESGRVYCMIGNRTSVTLEGIRVAARFVDDQGVTRESAKRHRETLPGGARDGVAMGWKTADSSSLDRRIRCEVQAARIADQQSG